MPSPLAERSHALYRRLQQSICDRLGAVDGSAAFAAQAWERSGGGGGLTRVLSEGPVLEKAAVNTSAVWGESPPGLAEHLGMGVASFYAAGISVIVHPRNPHAPTIHANLRYFETSSDQAGPPVAAWFGGGADLTPYYLYEEDAVRFHRVIAEVCHDHRVADYRSWKAECDRYFYLPHRGEARGVGGIFFDRLEDELEEVLAFQAALGERLMDAYLPTLQLRHPTPYGEREERWHLQRRGRYVEFNLIHDRGTRFGLETGGRIESILASLPPRVRWDYDARPAPDTPEERIVELLTGPPRDWV